MSVTTPLPIDTAASVPGPAFADRSPRWFRLLAHALLLSLSSVAAMVGAWWLLTATGAVRADLLPSPVVVSSAFVEVTTRG